MNKIIQYGLSKIADKLIEDGYSDRKATEVINKEHSPPTPISYSSFYRYRNIRKGNIKQEITIDDIQLEVDKALDRIYNYFNAKHQQKRSLRKYTKPIFDKLKELDLANKEYIDDYKTYFDDKLRDIQLDYANNVVGKLLNDLIRENPMIEGIRNRFWKYHREWFKQYEELE